MNAPHFQTQNPFAQEFDGYTIYRINETTIVERADGSVLLKTHHGMTNPVFVPYVLDLIAEMAIVYPTADGNPVKLTVDGANAIFDAAWAGRT